MPRWRASIAALMNIQLARLLAARPRTLPQHGEWRGMVEAYFGIALADMHEGNFESSLENYELALKLIGDRPASFTLGRIYATMAAPAGSSNVLRKESVTSKKAIGYYERTDHKSSAADGYNNLGINLILIGQWDRAHEAWTKLLRSPPKLMSAAVRCR